MSSTTAIHPGCAFCQTCLYDGWGDGTEEEIEALAAWVVNRFHELAHEATGDTSIYWQPATSEILYDCHGQTDDDHHWSDSLVEWPEDVDFGALLEQANDEAMER
ncbi:MAG: hypothetical protein ACYSWU_22220, partial [Planctomycetota bacterium]